VHVEESTDTIEDSMLAKGRVLMEPRPSNQLATYADIVDAQMDVIGLPAGPEGPGNVMLPAGLGISTKSAHQDVAARFISYWINDPEAGVTYKADQGVPGVEAQRDAMVESGELPDAQQRVFELFGQLEFASMSQLPGSAQEFLNAFTAGFEPVGFGASPAEGAAQLMGALPAELKP
jgi:multiple sugar transport system substrate-binding protein